MSKVIITHPSGNENTRAAVRGFHDAGLLHTFIVSVAVYPGSTYYRLLGLPGLSEFKKRVLPDNLHPYVKCYPYKEIARRLCDKLHIRSLTAHEVGTFSSWKVCRYIDDKAAAYLRKHAAEDVSAVYCYEDVALATFREAKQQKKLCLYDLPIGYWRYMHSLFEEEKKLHPEWEPTLGGLDDSEGKLKMKDEELRLADRIYVASTFTKKSLEHYPGKLAPIEVIPYGFPAARTDRRYDDISRRKIRLLYVGGLSQRKGIGYMFEALEGLSDTFELTVIGGGNIAGCPALASSLKKWNYMAPRPHGEVLDIMSRSDILIFASLFEGFGLVVTEAMSQGTPVITTDRTCGPDIITDGRDGWIIEAGSAGAIRDKLLYLSGHRDEITAAGKHCIETAAKRPWSVYERELAASVARVVGR